MPATPESPSARYFALLYSPTSQRPVLEALFGIEREVSDSLRAGLDHQVAHSRLQWWREECDRTAAGRPVHPLTRALADASVPLPKLAGLTGIVDMAIWDLAGATFETRLELAAYCDRWAAAMIEPLTPASTGSTKRDIDWRALGIAIREVELLADLAREAHYGRLRVPLDELQSADVDTSALAKPPWPNALAELIRARYTSLRGEIERVLGAVDKAEQPVLRGLLVWAALAWRLSLRAERALPDRLRPGRFDAIADAGFAWRCARRATMGRFRLN